MSNAEYTKLILSKMYDLLRPLGYRKRGQLFEKANSELVYLIGLQKSIYNTQQEIRATVNLAIWIKSLTPIRGGKPEKPNVWGAHLRYRIGNFLPSQNDKWWMVRSHDDAKKTGEDISKKLQKYALPEFDEFLTISDIINLWRKGIGPGLTDYEVKTHLKKLNANTKK